MLQLSHFTFRTGLTVATLGWTGLGVTLHATHPRPAAGCFCMAAFCGYHLLRSFVTAWMDNHWL